MNATINQLNKSRSRPTALPSPEYGRADTRIASAPADEFDKTIGCAQQDANEGKSGRRLDFPAH